MTSYIYIVGMSVTGISLGRKMVIANNIAIIGKCAVDGRQSAFLIPGSVNGRFGFVVVVAGKGGIFSDEFAIGNEGNVNFMGGLSASVTVAVYNGGGIGVVVVVVDMTGVVVVVVVTLLVVWTMHFIDAGKFAFDDVTG